RLLGLALIRLGDLPGAERELRVALAQAPGMVAAHDSLAALLRRDPARIGEASVHMARAELLRSRRKQARPRIENERAPATPALFSRDPPAAVDTRRVIIVVSGMPRSGTWMM